MLQAALLAVAFSSERTFELANDHLQLQVSKSADDAWLSFVGAPGSVNLLSVVPQLTPLWEVQFLTPDGLVQRNNRDATSAAVSATKEKLTLEWACSESIGDYSVRLVLSLPEDAHTAALTTEVENHGSTLGLWAITVSVGGITSEADDAVFYPLGYGVQQRGATAYPLSYFGRYPSNEATMQLLAAGGGARAGGRGIYLAAHDGNAHSKTLIWKAANSTSDRDDDDDAASRSTLDAGWGAVASADTDGPIDCRTPLLEPLVYTAAPKGPRRAQALAVSTVVSGAGAPFVSYTLPFRLALGVTAADAPLWFGASELYRDGFALSEAAWTADGPVSARPHVFPDWLVAANLWVNSGWQCYDRFNNSQGDPETVLASARAAAATFGLDGADNNGTTGSLGPLALHWYEWQCGFADECKDADSDHRFKFDTQYPDYFPPRKGDSHMKAVSSELRKANVRTFPYVNGRIFDQLSASFAADGGKSCARVPTSPTTTANNNTLPATPPSMCSEWYGSYELNGSKAQFAVADPTTAYWQSTYADVVRRLVVRGGVDGVYIDQLAAAAPQLDWTVANRTHGVGGGAWWRDGVASLLRRARAAVPGGAAALVTEGHAEYVMDVASGFLTIAAFGDAPLVQSLGDDDSESADDGAVASSQGGSATATSMMVPAFPAIYGGFYVGFGAIYAGADFVNPDVVCARLAAQFVYGSALGWFSLGGVTRGPKLDTSCGPMGTERLWESEAHAPEVAFVKALVAARAAMQRYLVHGRLARPPTLERAPPTFSSPPSSTPPRNRGPFPALSTAVWVTAASSSSSADGDTLPPSACVFLVAVTSAAVPAAFTLNVSHYLPGVGAVSLDLVGADGSRTRLGNFTGGSVRVDRQVAGRSVEMLEMRVASGSFASRRLLTSRGAGGPGGQAG